MRDFYKEARVFYEDGNRAEALKLYNQGIEVGDEKCFYGYAQFLHYGYEMEKDEERAIEIFREHYEPILALANSGDAQAMRIVGFYLYNGFGIEVDKEEAFQWFFKSADAGDELAALSLATLYDEGNLVEQSDKMALKYNKRAAELGNAKGQFNLALMYDLAQGVEKDPYEAVKWYQKAAEQGDVRAQHYLAISYLNGDGVEKSYEKAIEWYIKAANQGYAEAQFSLGCIYDQETGVDRDAIEGAKWYKIAAEQDHVGAQLNLAYMYYYGEGVEQSYELAFHWFEKAAEKGQITAQYNLAIMYENGDGVEESNEKAVEWWKKACEGEKIHSSAAYHLGYAYYDGDGVDRDLQKAKYYFELARENGYACSYAVDMVKNELGQKTSGDVMREYADQIISKKISIAKIYPRVLKDLKRDFGKSWDKLDEKSQSFLATAMVSHIALCSMGKHVRGYLDFSAAITPMFKALELEIGKYLYTGYINYLNENNIPVSTFKSKRSFIKAQGLYDFSYRDPDDLSDFTLGSLHMVVGLDKNTQAKLGFSEGATKKSNEEKQQKPTIDEPMLEYVKSIFDDKAFGKIDVDRAITDYLVDLCREISSITDSFRNPAAHANIMSCVKAEKCADYLIKSNKIICKFMEKLKEKEQEDE